MLHMSMPEWVATPWYEQQMLLEGMNWEIGNGGIYPKPGGSQGGGGGEREFTDLSGASDDVLAALGVQVRSD